MKTTQNAFSLNDTAMCSPIRRPCWYSVNLRQSPAIDIAGE